MCSADRKRLADGVEDPLGEREGLAEDSARFSLIFFPLHRKQRQVEVLQRGPEEGRRLLVSRAASPEGRVLGIDPAGESAHPPSDCSWTGAINRLKHLPGDLLIRGGVVGAAREDKDRFGHFRSEKKEEKRFRILKMEFIGVLLTSAEWPP